jgi:hypothetical protein
LNFCGSEFIVKDCWNFRLCERFNEKEERTWVQNC